MKGLKEMLNNIDREKLKGIRIEKESVNQMLEKTGPVYLAAVGAAVGLQALFVLFQHVFHKSSLILAILLFFVPMLAFLLLKDQAEEKHRHYAMRLFQASVVLLSMSVMTHFVLTFTNWVEMKTPGKGDALFRVNYLIDLLSLVTMVGIMNQDKNKELFENMRDESVWEKLGLLGGDDGPKTGDVKLCTNGESGKPVYWRYKDRFLHMLILGPTGSGKTSQTIIPLLNQDVQNLEAGITVIEPKGDLAEKVHAMAEHYGRKAVYFNPVLPNCPVFNPLYGKEEDVIENMATTFKMLSPDSPQFFLDMNENLIRNSLKVLKRLMGNKATLVELSRLIHNSGGEGRKMVTNFSRLQTETAEMAKENADIAAWFLNDYFNEKSKTYEHCSGIRSQVSKITSNKYLRKVLNPENGENDLDFDKHLKEGGIITISTAQGDLRDLGRYLGYFIILQFQSAVFRRPGNENTRRAHFLYIDEFQTYSNPGFADMLTQGRSYRVASHLATQNRALIGMGSGRDGKSFIELVSTNARNVVIYPGGNIDDAKYYSAQFGEIMEKTVQKGTTRQKFNPLKGIKPMSYDSESIREVDETKARFSINDIIYRQFGEIIYTLIDNNSIQPPDVGKIEYIPYELNEKLDQMVAEFKEKAMKEHPDEVPEVVMDESLDVEPVVVDVTEDGPKDKAAKFASKRDYVEKEVLEDVVIDDDFIAQNDRQSSHSKFNSLDDQDDMYDHLTDGLSDDFDDDLI